MPRGAPSRSCRAAGPRLEHDRASSTSRARARAAPRARPRHSARRGDDPPSPAGVSATEPRRAAAVACSWSAHAAATLDRSPDHVVVSREAARQRVASVQSLVAPLPEPRARLGLRSMVTHGAAPARERRPATRRSRTHERPRAPRRPTSPRSAGPGPSPPAAPSASPPRCSSSAPGRRCDDAVRVGGQPHEPERVPQRQLPVHQPAGVARRPPGPAWPDPSTRTAPQGIRRVTSWATSSIVWTSLSGSSRPITITLSARGGGAGVGGGSIPLGITRIFVRVHAEPALPLGVGLRDRGDDLGGPVHGARQSQREPRGDVTLAGRRRLPRGPTAR